MRMIRLLLEKEFRQIFRNKALLPLIFAMPIIQLVILPLAADFEVKNINVAIIDHDHSDYANKLIQTIKGSGYFKLVATPNQYKSALNLVELDQADLILEIPLNFERNLIRINHEDLLLSINAINGVKANLGGAYLNKIILEFNQELRLKWIPPNSDQLGSTIEITTTNWFNPLMNYKFFMVPGILAILVTMVGGFMCALNIVKEKEIGTIEQINVTPISKFHFIIGKLLPFWLIGIFVFSIGLWVVARNIYGIVPIGNILLLYSFLGLYLIALLGFGLLISTYSETQQQAISVAFFFIMIFILMSGLFTPIDSMPQWARYIARMNPVTYFIEVMRMIVLKGSTFNDIKYHFIVISGFTIFLNGWAILNYKKSN